MQKIVSTICLLLTAATLSYTQELTLKEKALDEFQKEHYHEAIKLLERAVKDHPDDAEIYYYLGWFSHYNAYDSRPLSGYDYSYSQQIFEYLDKALELNPDYGDAKYFYGAECSGNAFTAMQNYDAEKLKYFYKLAYEKGAYPDWLIEFGKNILMSCNENAILFTGGNADFDVCAYLQLLEDFRTDITIIPLGNIDRPWYVKFLKDGLAGCVRNVNINLTDNQIMDIHPFKWDTTNIFVNISSEDRIKFGLEEDHEIQWTIAPDLTSLRLHSKMKGETAKPRTYLSPQRAVLLQIIEDNFSDRPVYFSNFAEPTYYAGLNNRFQNCGIISKLTPVETKQTDHELDISEFEKLLTEENLVNYKNVKDNNFPRISGMIMSGYTIALVNLAGVYKKNGETVKLKELTDLYKNHLKTGLNPDFEMMVVNRLEN